MFDDLVEDWKCKGASGTPGCAGRPQPERSGTTGNVFRYYDYIVWDGCKGDIQKCPYHKGEK